MRIHHIRYLTSGAVLLGLGANLILSTHFYRWPPLARNPFVPSLLGIWAIITAMGFLAISLVKHVPERLNLSFILSASGLLGMDSVVEIGHAVIFNDPVRTSLAILTVAFLFEIWSMAKDANNS